MATAKIIYTETDEAPALATYSLLPIIKAFTDAAGIEVETRDISLAGRIIAAFSDRLSPERAQSDDLAELGALARTQEANIIKLPNISASIPQLKAAIAELQGQGYDLPDYPDEAGDEASEAVRARYARVLGSAVNPVLREGNSDRRVAAPVKAYARSHPHSMGAWSGTSQSHVAHMQEGDFYSSEQSLVAGRACTVRVELVAGDGGVTPLKESIPLQEGEVLDASRMSRRALRAFYEREMADAKESGLLLSLHLKATMMKVSDPILFGHAVSVYYRDLFEKHADVFAELGIDPNNGVGDLLTRIATLPGERRASIEADIRAVHERRPPLAMVNSDKGITNLHV
ncbi:MAG: isocitrate dehydrogenase, partial [Candidatus Sedimenticola endophacoides]